MKESEIELKRSIESEKLIYNENVLLRILEIPWIIFWITFFPYLFSYKYFQEINVERIDTLIVPFLFILPSGLIAFCYFQLNNLKRCKHLINGNNKIIVENYLDDLIKRREWAYLENDSQIKVLDIPFHDRATGWDKRITVIFDNEDLLINCSTFGMGGLRLPFDLLCNRYLENQIVRKLEQRIKKAPQQRV